MACAVRLLGVNKIREMLGELNDCTALTLLLVIAVELAYIGHELTELVSKL